MGIYKGKAVPWDEVMREYYSIRGWSNDGIPSRNKIIELNLEEVTKKLDLPES
jgi:aldehyde:ferredoxin oxidoreductase